MRELRGRARFAHEAVATIRILHVAAQHQERDATTQIRIDREPHDAHPALPELRHDLEAADVLRHRRGRARRRT
ncbi:MAG: hypothetical protein NT062_19180 [Proteobacteria bacterium]|nr:hypothetical protein [Pseudomonadota bacterium]